MGLEQKRHTKHGGSEHGSGILLEPRWHYSYCPVSRFLVDLYVTRSARARLRLSRCSLCHGLQTLTSYCPHRQNVDSFQWAVNRFFDLWFQVVSSQQFPLGPPGPSRGNSRFCPRTTSSAAKDSQAPSPTHISF